MQVQTSVLSLELLQISNLASFQGYSQLFNVAYLSRATLKKWEWPVDKATSNMQSVIVYDVFFTHSIRDHSHNGIGAQWIVIDAVNIVRRSSDNRSLRCLKPVHLEVHPVRE